MSRLTSTVPKPFVFVLMPFDEAYRDAYELGIKAACTEASAYSERLDEQIFTENMLDRIYNQIAKADIVIADMSGRNPNVFYEVGYAHALNKKVILLTQNADDIPFDLKHYPHIVYGGKIVELKKDLCERVRWLIAQPSGPVVMPCANLQVVIRRIDLSTKPQVPEKHRGGIYTWRACFDIHNPETGVVRKEVFRVGLISTDHFVMALEDQQEDEPNIKHIQLPGKERLHLIDREYSISPGGWEQIPVGVSCRGNLGPQTYEWPFSVRLFSGEGTRELPFTIRVAPAEIG